jgi:hypothetical protein
MADHVGACTAALMPLYELIKAHVFAAERIDGDDTRMPVLAKVKCRTGRLWTYVRDHQPFGVADPPAAVFFSSPDRSGEHPERHLVGYTGILQADAYAGFNTVCKPERRPGPDHRSGVLGARETQVLRTHRHRLEGARQDIGFDLADRIRGRAEDRCCVHAGTRE